MPKKRSIVDLIYESQDCRLDANIWIRVGQQTHSLGRVPWKNIGFFGQTQITSRRGD